MRPTCHGARRCCCLTAALGLAGGAWAAALRNSPPSCGSSGWKSSTARPCSKPAQLSKPGDVLEYRVRYTNRSASAVTGLVANLPIPRAPLWLRVPSCPPGVLASTDGAHFALRR